MKSRANIIEEEEEEEETDKSRRAPGKQIACCWQPEFKGITVGDWGIKDEVGRHD
jgi:hypothetical protein